MRQVDLTLQLKFLKDLDTALDEAMCRYSEEKPDKLAELTHMQDEVRRATDIVERRIRSGNAASKSTAKTPAKDRAKGSERVEEIAY